MKRTLTFLLAAWFGYPGRLLLLLALVTAVSSGWWQARQIGQAKTNQAVSTVENRLYGRAENVPPATPEALTAIPGIAALTRYEPDGAVSASISSTSTPSWLPRERRTWNVGAQRYVIDIIPLSAPEMVALWKQHTLPPLGIGLTLALLLALWAARPIAGLREWLTALDQGRFSQAPPHSPWPLKQVVSELKVLGERLRHARSALQARQSATDRANKATIRELQQELTRTRQEQEGISAMGDSRGELLRTMSHEMRTPLTAIIGYADLLSRNDPSPEVGEYSGVISRSARNLLGMINNLLDLARIEAGALQPQSSEFDVTELIEDTVALLAPLAFDKALELNTLIYHDVPTRLRGDSLRLAQVLTNLLSNAIKYTDEGEVIIRLLQERRDQDSITLRLEVEDTGRGLDEEQQQKLFQAWRRFEVAGSKASGSGLGLAIVHKLLDVLDGRIEVESTPGKGSRFIASVPCRTVAPPRSLTRWDALRGMRVWVCESHPTTAKALSHLLTFWEVDFRLWAHAGELYDALQDVNTRVDAQALILGLDFDHGHASTVNDILTIPAKRRPPTLVLVPSIDATTHKKWRSRGANSVLSKGSPRTSLYDALGMLAAPNQTGNPTPLENHRVLVADNNRAGLRILQTQLQKLGATVDSVESGTEALELWQQHPYALALLDYHMPGLDGKRTAEQMRTSPYNRDAPLVGMSAWLDPSEEEAWRQAGIDAVLVKPFDMERLLRVLRQRRDQTSDSRDNDNWAQTSLLNDPEMASLLRDELPRQWQELDSAFIAGQLKPVRDAAHQLHGTAAFLHLQPLQNDLAQFERFLAEKKSLEDLRLPELMARIQQGIRTLLAELDSLQIAE